MPHIWEMVASPSCHKNVVEHQGQSGLIYQYQGAKNRLVVRFTTVNGLDEDEMWALIGEVQDVVGSLYEVTDAMGVVYNGQARSIEGHRPVLGAKTYGCTLELWDPTRTEP